MSAKTNLTLDLTIFTAFLVIANPHFTGNTIHEWLGVAFAATLVTHLLFHWEWIVKIGAEFFKKLFHPSRLNFVVDSLFFIAMTTAMLTGLMISKDVVSALGISLEATGGSWKMIHKLSSDASLILLALHTALHWKWITSNLGRHIVTPIRQIFSKSVAAGLTAQPVRVEKNK